MNRFPKDSRVCFIGDSITCNNDYVSRVVAYYHENFPDENINFYNCGASGASSQDILAMFDVDTATYRPTHAVLMFGVNDSGREKLVKGRSEALYTELKTQFEGYQKNLKVICRKLKELGVEITLATPVPVDEYSGFSTPTLPGAFALMSAYAEYVRNYAREEGYPVIDQFAEFTKLLVLGERIYNDDRIHPNELGQYYLAKNILQAQGLTAPEYAPIPEYLNAWREKVRTYRTAIMTGECLFLHRFDLPEEESLATVKKRLETEQDNHLKYIGNLYLQNKPNAARVKTEMLYEMETALKNGR